MIHFDLKIFVTILSLSIVPRGGVHNSVKYSKYRSVIKQCPECDVLFLNFKGRKVCCGPVCSMNRRRQRIRDVNLRIIRMRNKTAHAEKERFAYHEGKRKKKYRNGSKTDYIPSPPLDSDGSFDESKISYMELIHEMVRKLRDYEK